MVLDIFSASLTILADRNVQLVGQEFLVHTFILNSDFGIG
jgi:hypothetical protein